MRFFTKKRAVILGIVAAMAFSAAAVAYFTTGGSGTGSATVGTSSSALITQTNTLAALYPAAGSQAVNLDIKNTGSGSQFVGAVHLVSIAADAGHSSCDVSSSGVNAAFTMADVPVNATLAAGATTSKVGSLAMNDTGVSQDSCQGATLTLTFSSN
jgi:hypothetical protein